MADPGSPLHTSAFLHWRQRFCLGNRLVAESPVSTSSEVPDPDVGRSVTMVVAPFAAPALVLSEPLKQDLLLACVDSLPLH